MCEYKVFCVLLSILSISLAAHIGHQQLIFGGERGVKGQFPYLVSLQVTESEETRHICGGAILTNRYILSAAHCYSPSFKIEQYRVVVGAQDRDNDGTSYTLNKYTRHPKFTSVERSNDIGIIELTNEIVFNENVAAIDFDRTFIDGDQPAVFAGYGRSEDDYTGLKYVQLNTITNDKCRELAPSSAPIFDFTTLCAFSGQNGTGICLGDSGGPLTLNGKVIGIASWAKLCAKGVPDGFTRVSEYVEWIESFMPTASN